MIDMKVELREDRAGAIFFGMLGAFLAVAAILIVILAPQFISWPMLIIPVLAFVLGLIFVRDSIDIFQGNYESGLDISETGLTIQMENGSAQKIPFSGIKSAAADFKKWSADIVRVSLVDDEEELEFKVDTQETAERIAEEIMNRLKNVRKDKRI